MTAGRAVERPLKSGEAHLYKIQLKTGQYFHIGVNQRGVDVVLSLSGPDGKNLIERDRPNGSVGPESLSAIAAAGGEYRVTVKASEDNTEEGTYQIESQSPRLPTSIDRKRVEAETVFYEGMQLDGSKNAESAEQACEKFEIATGLWQEIGDAYPEALTQVSLGSCREGLGEFERAATAYERAVFLYGELKIRKDEAESLGSLSLVNILLQKPETGIDQYLRARAIFRDLKDAGREKQLNAGLADLANRYYDYGDKLSDKRQAAAFDQALAIFATAKWIFKILEDGPGEALALLAMGKVHSSLGNKRNALALYKQALPLWREASDRNGEATTLNNIGLMFSQLGRKQEALGHYDKALVLYRAEGDRSGEATTLSNFGLVYFDLSDNKKALDYYSKALAIKTEIKDREGEAVTLDNIGLVYDALGKKQQAFDVYNQAFLIWEETGNKSGEAKNRNNLGFLYNSLGERRRALDYYTEALALIKVEGSKSAEATVLNNMGGVYASLGEKEKALDYYLRALPLRKDAGDKSGEATTTSNLGLTYDSMGKKQEALGFYEQALPLRREVGDRAGEAITLNNIGGVYDSIGEKQKALDHYTQALAIWRAIEDMSGEATTLGNMMFSGRAAGNPRLAVFYGKLAVNSFQRLRRTVYRLNDKEVEKTYLKSVEETYRVLSELLIEQGRLAEALQVIDSAKGQEYFDLDPALKTPPPIALTEREARLSLSYETAIDNLGKIRFGIDDLKRTIENKTPVAGDEAALQRLESDLNISANRFSTALKEIENESARPPAGKDDAPAVPDVREIQALLNRLRSETKEETVAVYTLAGENNFYALIVTGDRIVSVRSSVKRAELTMKAMEFAGRLGKFDKQAKMPAASEDEIRNKGKELYDIIMAPVLAKFGELGVKPDVLMWSLEGALRYFPVGALYDGKQYLAGQYRNILFSQADSKRMLAPVKQTWTASGFYNSKEYTIIVQGKVKRFDALEYAKTEVETIFGTPEKAGIISGDVTSNEQFTKDSMLKALKLRRPLVHIASHFRFEPGDADLSFLLLGNDAKLTLEEIKNMPDDLFIGVELLTISACETGLQKERESDGREIYSFAELAQLKGAEAVLASLWKVDDASTSQLMAGFYGLRESKKLTKAQALQKAQLALINSSDFSHPYYWAPFVLVGNWR
ncbi:MAG TPA: CHAT domain-containing tetratricopeptide repeat protein [Pyrinomonadaceae bacterium]|nr:CHAT domain-containing tetratricopeptide repeat protein [Pyrinomonadaceae bacterium]